MAVATLTISSRNYSSWSLRGWLLTRMSGLPSTRSSCRSPTRKTGRSSCCSRPRCWCRGCRTTAPRSGTPGHRRVPPRGVPGRRAPARRPRGPGAVPLDLRRDALGVRQPPLGPADEPEGPPPRLQDLAGAKADVDRITTIWRECLATWKGPYLFGKLSMADAMYAPVVTRFLTYDVTLDDECAAYGRRIMRSPTWSSGSRRRAPSPTRSRSSTSSSDDHLARHAQRAAPLGAGAPRMIQDRQDRVPAGLLRRLRRDRRGGGRPHPPHRRRHRAPDHARRPVQEGELVPRRPPVQSRAHHPPARARPRRELARHRLGRGAGPRRAQARRGARAARQPVGALPPRQWVVRRAQVHGQPLLQPVRRGHGGRRATSRHSSNLAVLPWPKVPYFRRARRARVDALCQPPRLDSPRSAWPGCGGRAYRPSAG